MRRRAPSGREYPSPALGNQQAMHVTVAAAGDIHCSEEERTRLQTAFADADRRADLILLAGDLTTYGEPEQGAVLADVTREIETPILPCSGTTTGTQTGTKSSPRRFVTAGSDCSSGPPRPATSTVSRSGSRGRKASSEASPTPCYRTSASRSCGGSTPRRARRSRPSTAG